ncbi:MAG: TRAP transporter large permease subunit [Pseudomonadota bacterium]|nr:TRAP transporter large permease subunit [Pseudomonadota bacterium]
MAVIILVIMPIIPTAALGIDPIYFGIVAVVKAMIGLITPPFGMMLFVTNAVVGIPMRDMAREIWGSARAIARATDLRRVGARCRSKTGAAARE